MTINKRHFTRTPGILVWMAWVLLFGYAIVVIANHELEASTIQAWLLSRLDRGAVYQLGPGASPAIRFPHSGPYDKRLGYELIPDFVRRLMRSGYSISEQARSSPELMRLARWGINPPYHEKNSAGLTLTDSHKERLYEARFPERSYARFEDVPPVLAQSLLFIENHELLDPAHPRRNPAVEWKRFAKALVDQAVHAVDDDSETPGGSTLATQIEKYRHSPGGRTPAAGEKLRQMASASLRAYLDGETTLPVRRQLVVDYMDSMPLLAKSGYGEVNGLGDGLWAWYGRDFAEVNRLLAPLPAAGAKADDQLAARALAFKQALSLLIAQRRPAYYLGSDPPALAKLTDSHLRLLAAAGIIPPALRDAALQARLEPRPGALPRRPLDYAANKAVIALRTSLAGMLNLPRLYDVDRLDLAVETPLDGASQRAVADVLTRLKDPQQAKAMGLYGNHLFQEGDEPGRLVFSVVLFESNGRVNRLRVQADSLDQPFDINEGARLDLGSTAKLRTLVTYLEIVQTLHDRYEAMAPEALAAVRIAPSDVLSRWAIDYLAKAKEGERDIRPMLLAALERTYSANPGEVFFTGGGAHIFHNFEKKEDHQTYTVRHGFEESINLVFVRLMRDVERYYADQAVGDRDRLLDDGDDPRRASYLARFADEEGSDFLGQFYRDFHGRSADQVMDLLLKSAHPTPSRLAAIFRSVDPQADAGRFAAFLAARLPKGAVGEDKRAKLYSDFAPGRYTLADRAYIAHVHPLALWLAGYLRSHPEATLSQALEASRAERQAAYAWLFMPREKAAQDVRIRIMLEEEAFREIGRAWRRLGYPFDNLTPSYATAIGASGDRPAALAELMGIIINQGVRLPQERIHALRFGAGTPFDTRMEYAPQQAWRVMPPAVADVVRETLVGVVERGTAGSVKGAYVRADGSRLTVGGKTGTGEHRFDVIARGGVRTSSRIVDRSGTFVFYIGDRFFGTVTAYVHEPYAERYRFSSALSVRVLGALAPALMKLVDAPVAPGLVASR